MTPKSDTLNAGELKGHEVLVGVTGGIAAYKVCDLVSKLVQRGAGVTVAMTRAARRFVGPVTFEALSGRSVMTSLWRSTDHAEVQHISVSGSCDLTLIAPATANIIGKIANGIADDIVSTLVICADSPVVLAPAMNDRMWSNPIVVSNVAKLTDLGYHVIPPVEGWLACRSVGAGRMADPATILEAIVPILRSNPPKRREGPA